MKLQATLPIAALIVLTTTVIASAQHTAKVIDPFQNQDNGFQPLLGFQGEMNGRGMEVIQVRFGSIAERLGLESGDVITHLNGTRVRSYQHYLRLLRSATRDNGGRVAIRIDNVRWWTGESSNRYVYRAARFSAPQVCVILE